LRLSTKNQAGEVIDRLRKELLSTQRVLVKTQNEKDKLTSEISTKWKTAHDSQVQHEREWKAERLKLKKKIANLEQENSDLKWDNGKMKEEIKHTDKVFRELSKEHSDLEKSYKKVVKENKSNKMKVDDLTSQIAKADKLRRGRLKKVDRQLSAKEARLEIISSKTKTEIQKVLKVYKQEIQKMIGKLSEALKKVKLVMDDTEECKDAMSSLDEVNTIAGNLAWQASLS